MTSAESGQNSPEGQAERQLANAKLGFQAALLADETFRGFLGAWLKLNDADLDDLAIEPTKTEKRGWAKFGLRVTRVGDVGSAGLKAPIRAINEVPLGNKDQNGNIVLPGDLVKNLIEAKRDPSEMLHLLSLWQGNVDMLRWRFGELADFNPKTGIFELRDTAN